MLRKGRIRGSSFSAYYNGILVVDLMGGASSLDAQRLWSPETLGLVWSVSKTIAGLCVALLVQRYYLLLILNLVFMLFNL